MGIVMRHYNWPYSAFIPNTIDSLGHISTDRHIATYDWDMMPNTIHDSTDVAIVNEIARLLKDCGYASRMKYGMDGSAASFDSASYALEHIFHYKNVRHLHRSSFYWSWLNTLKTEIAADRPIIYAGYGSEGKPGHAVVLYGYTDQNRFMINWGWGNSGLNNGAFLLDSLCVQDFSNFNYRQEAILGFTPDYPECNDYNQLQQSDFSDNYFEIYRDGVIYVPGITIQNSQSGTVLASEQIHIAGGFKAESGTHLIFEVKDMVCNDRESLYLQESDNILDVPPATKKRIGTVFQTTKKINREGLILIIRDGKAFTIMGQQVDL